MTWKRTLWLMGVIPLVFNVADGANKSERSLKTEPDIPLIHSTQVMTPNDLYEIALRHNPDHLKNVQNASLSGVNLRSAWGTLLPSLDVSYGIQQSSFYNPTYTNPDGTVAQFPIEWYEPTPVIIDYVVGADTLKVLGWDPNDSTLHADAVTEDKSRASWGQIRLQETINLGGREVFTIKNAILQNRMNDLQVAFSELDLYYNVRQNYYAVLAYKRLFDLAQKVLEQKKEQLRLAQARYQVGSVTELDVLQAEIDLGNQENAVIEAENNLKLAKEELNRILGIDLDSEYALMDEFHTFVPEYSLEELTSQAILSRPDYHLYQDQERYYRNNVHINRGQFFPNLTASASHTRSENSGVVESFTIEPRNRNTTLALTLSWNLFSGFADEAQLQESRVAFNNARHDRKKQEQLIQQGVRQAYYALMQSYEQSKVTEKNRELASRQLTLEQERYRLGATSQLNLRTAQVTYEQAETDHISSIFNFWTNLAALERAVGKKLNS